MVANYREEPLTNVLERLLVGENYLLGVRGAENEDGPGRVAWIRVTGSVSEADGVVPQGMEVPSAFGSADFAAESSEEQRRAVQTVAAGLLADEERVQEFLQVQPRALAQSLRQYPHVDELLAKMAESQHPAVGEKIGAVIEELRRLQDSSPQ